MKTKTLVILFGLYLGQNILNGEEIDNNYINTELNPLAKAVVGSNPNEPIDLGENSALILAGYKTTIEKRPYMASIQVKMEGGWVHICGGALVSAHKVVTAQHCLIYWGKHRYRVGLGFTYLSVGPKSLGSRFIEVYKVARKGTHEDVEEEFRNDIAVLTLRKCVSFSKKIKPISLAVKATGDFAGVLCTISGWGMTSRQGGLSDRLQTAQTRPITMEQCRIWNNLITPELSIERQHLCVFNYPISSCLGDSGGPLVCNNRLAGVSSFITGGCTGCFPQGFARVSFFYKWLKEKIRN